MDLTWLRPTPWHRWMSKGDHAQLMADVEGYHHPWFLNAGRRRRTPSQRCDQRRAALEAKGWNMFRCARILVPRALCLTMRAWAHRTRTTTLRAVLCTRALVHSPSAMFKLVGGEQEG